MYLSIYSTKGTVSRHNVDCRKNVDNGAGVSSRKIPVSSAVGVVQAQFGDYLPLGPIRLCTLSGLYRRVVTEKIVHLIKLQGW